MTAFAGIGDDTSRMQIDAPVQPAMSTTLPRASSCLASSKPKHRRVTDSAIANDVRAALRAVVFRCAAHVGRVTKKFAGSLADDAVATSIAFVPRFNVLRALSLIAPGLPRTLIVSIGLTCKSLNFMVPAVGFEPTTP